MGVVEKRRLAQFALRTAARPVVKILNVSSVVVAYSELSILKISLSS